MRGPAVAITDMQKLLRLCGVPRAYWNATPNPLVFKDILYRRYNGYVVDVRAEEQEKWYSRILEDPRIITDEPKLIVIGSTEADFAAMTAATVLVKLMVGKGLKTYVAPVMTEERVMSYQDWKSKTRDALLLYNITYHSPMDHLQRLRNWIVKYDKVTRIVVCGGINPINLMESKLFYRPVDFAFFVEEDLS